MAVPTDSAQGCRMWAKALGPCYVSSAAENHGAIDVQKNPAMAPKPGPSQGLLAKDRFQDVQEKKGSGVFSENDSRPLFRAFSEPEAYSSVCETSITILNPTSKTPCQAG